MYWFCSNNINSIFDRERRGDDRRRPNRSSTTTPSTGRSGCATAGDSRSRCQTCLREREKKRQKSASPSNWQQEQQGKERSHAWEGLFWKLGDVKEGSQAHDAVEHHHPPEKQVDLARAKERQDFAHGGLRGGQKEE